MMLVGALLCCFSGVAGIFLSWHFSVAPSAAIVLLMTGLFVLAYLFAPERGLVWTLLSRNRLAASDSEESH
jgi:manganese/iron transport system permease protein